MKLRAKLKASRKKLVEETKLPLVSHWRKQGEKFECIPESFDKAVRGYGYDQIKREDVVFDQVYQDLTFQATKTVCMYEVIETVDLERFNTIIGYEVFTVKFSRATERSFGGTTVIVDPKELYPSDESFGTTAWYYAFGPDAKIKADKKFESLKNN